METKTVDQLRAEIREETERWAVATVYSLQNDFTNVAEKFEIECWAQLPDVCAGYAFLAGALLYGRGLISGWEAYAIGGGVEVLVSVLCWFAYKRTWVVGLFLKLRSRWLAWSLHLAVGVWCFALSRYWLGSFVLLSLITGYMQFWPWGTAFRIVVTRKYQMNPRYAFLKHFYGKSYAFETSAKRGEQDKALKEKR